MELKFGATTGAYPKNLNRQVHGLRGFAALAVFVFHVYGMASLWGFWPPSFDPLDELFIAGRHGVEIFFIISGYLITGSLVRHRSVRTFLIDRAIRIYPVFMTIQLLVFGLGPLIHYKWLSGITPAAWATAFVSNGLFLPGLLDLPLAQLNAWSLSYEAAFYLLSAATFTIARVAGRWIAVIALALSLTPIFAAYPKAVFFLVGTAVFFITRGGGIFLPGWGRVLSIPAFLLTLVLLTISETNSQLIFIAFAPALLFFWAVVEGKDRLSAILKMRFLLYMGTISYSFYLWSPVVTYPMKLLIQNILHGRVNDMVNVAFFAIVGFAASVAVADLSYRLLEARAGRVLHRWVRSNG